jgi:endonuclease-3
MTSSNRAALLAKVQKVLKKHYKSVIPAERPLLEQIVYACCLENARPEAADEAFAKLQEMFFDWNEIRVTTVAELTEVLGCLPDAGEAAQRLKRCLQGVFETYYTFDLEALKKQNLGKSEKDLEKVAGGSVFVLSYVVQNALGGPSIPVNKGAIEVLYGVGVINDVEAAKMQVPGMERAIPKNKGVEFGGMLQQIGADFNASPGSSKLKAILAEIDPGFKDRLAQRNARLEKEAQEAAAAAVIHREKERAKAAKARAEEAAKKPKGKGSKGKDQSKAAKEQPKSVAKDQPKVTAKEQPKPAAKPVEPAKPVKPVSKSIEPAKPISKDTKKPPEKGPLKDPGKKISQGLAKKKPR